MVAQTPTVSRKILFAGDICLPSGRLELQADLSSDLLLANLEGPLLSDPSACSPAVKAGPHLHNSPATLSEILTHESTCLSLANNHLMDFGLQGLQATKTVLKHSDCPSAGADENLRLARRPLYRTLSGLEVAVICCCEQQFGAADLQRGGTAIIGPWVAETIRQEKLLGRTVIVSVHAGVEDSPWPTPGQQQLFRFWIECGAAVVHVHHSHVPRGWESYRKGFILYGTGNFLVEPERWKASPAGQWSVLWTVEECSDGSRTVHPKFCCVQSSRTHTTLRDVSAIERERCHSWIEFATAPLTDPVLLEALHQEFSMHLYEKYYRQWMALTPSFLTTLAGRIRSIFPSRWTQPSRTRRSALHFHLFACDSHRESLSTAFGLLSGEVADLRDAHSHSMLNRALTAASLP